jgi:hypothetical protein
MISIEKCKKILNANGKSYTDEEVFKIREFLYQLAEIDYLQYQEIKKLDSNQNINSDYSFSNL